MRLFRERHKGNKGSVLFPFLVMIPGMIFLALILVDVVGVYLAMDRVYSAAQLAAFAGSEQVNEQVKQMSNQLTLNNPVAQQAANTTASSDIANLPGQKSVTVSFVPVSAQSTAQLNPQFGAQILEQIQVTVSDNYPLPLLPVNITVPISFTQKAAPQESFNYLP